MVHFVAAYRVDEYFAGGSVICPDCCKIPSESSNENIAKEPLLIFTSSRALVGIRQPFDESGLRSQRSPEMIAGGVPSL